MNKKKISVISSAICFVLGLLLVFIVFGLKKPVSSDNKKVFYAYREGSKVVLYVENAGLYSENAGENDVLTKVTLSYPFGFNQDNKDVFCLSSSRELDANYFSYVCNFDADWKADRFSNANFFSCCFTKDSDFLAGNFEECSVIWIENCVDFQPVSQTESEDNKVRINVLYTENANAFVKGLFTGSEYGFNAKMSIDSIENDATVSDKGNQFESDSGDELKPGKHSVKMIFNDNSNNNLTFSLEDKLEIVPTISDYVITDSDYNIVYDLDSETEDSRLFCDGEYTVSFQCDYNVGSFQSVTHMVYDVTIGKSIYTNEAVGNDFSNTFTSSLLYVNHKIIFVTLLECSSGETYYVCNGKLLTKFFKDVENGDYSLDEGAYEQLKNCLKSVSNHIACLSVNQYFRDGDKDKKTDKNIYAIKNEEKVAFSISAPNEEIKIKYNIDDHFDGIKGETEIPYDIVPTPLVSWTSLSEPNDWIKVSDTAEYILIVNISNISKIGYLTFDISIELPEGTDRFDAMSLAANERVKEYPPISLDSPTISSDAAKIVDGKKVVGDLDTIELDFHQDEKGEYYNEKLTVDSVSATFPNDNKVNDKELTAKYNFGKVNIKVSELEFEDESFFADDEVISLKIRLSDEAGNSVTYTVESSDLYYYSDLVIYSQIFTEENVVENDNNVFYIDDDSKIRIKVNANHSELNYVVNYMYVDEFGEEQKVCIKGGHFNSKSEEIILDKSLWRSDHPVEAEQNNSDSNNNAGENWWDALYINESWSQPDQERFTFEINFTDATGSMDSIRSANRTYIYFSEMSVQNELKYKSNCVVADDVIDLSVNSLDSNGCSSKHKFEFKEVKLKCFVGDVEVTCIDATPEKKNFANNGTCAIPMSLIDSNEDLKGKDNIKVKVVYTLIDECDNRYPVEDDDLCVTFYRPISDSITDVHIYGKNALEPFKKCVKNGDQVIVKFKSSHPLSEESVLVQGDDFSQGGNIYRISGKVKGNDYYFLSDDRVNWYCFVDVTSELGWNDGENIDFSVDLKDGSANQTYTLTDKESSDSVTYHAPIEASDLQFVSDNEVSGYKLANDSNVITLSFTSKHLVSVKNAKIGGKEVVFGEPELKEGIYYYSHSVNVRELDLTDNKPIKFEFTLSDEANNTPVTITNERCENLIYQAPISVFDPDYKSNNSFSANYAIDGDLISVSFETSHPVDIASASVSGIAITMTSTNNDHMHWVGVYTVKNGDISDMNNLKISIKLTDASGNPSYEFGNNGIQYFAPVRVTACSVYSDNANDSSKYVIDGNNVFVRFKTNHKIDINSSNFSIAGYSVASVTETTNDDGSCEYVFSRKINNGELTDLSNVVFGLSVTDAAGNSKVSVDQSSSLIANTLTYYAPLAVTTSISSSGTNSGYAKNGDTITIVSKVNHSASVVSSSVADRSLSSVSDANTITSTYTIPENENSMNEGKLTAALNYTDVAGNNFSIDSINEGSVTYDRTAPSISFMNAYSNFTKSDFSFDVTIVDKNIDSEGTAVYINDSKRTIGNGIDTNGTTYSTKIASDGEGTYTIKVTASDLAGNVAQEIEYKVIVDKTDPKITTTTVYSSKNKVYSPGITIADLVDIDELYVDTISCTVSDGASQTSGDWDIDKPITTDGKKTITVIVTDSADNSSQLQFDLYIDGTAPNPIITDSLTNTVLVAGANIFDEKASLTFKLQDLSYDPDAPDKFTKLQITCPDGKVVDLINGNYVNDAGDYAFDFTESGTYTITLEAVDDLGNSTGEMSYELTIKERPMDAVKTFIEEKTGVSPENSGKLLIGIACSAAGVVAIILVAAVVIIKRKRR